jgi:predicted DCC family thiol-disulfide oxidoreductase YuxK
VSNLFRGAAQPSEYAHFFFQFIPRVIRDAIYDLVARNRYRWFGRRDACIQPNSDRSWPS